MATGARSGQERNSATQLDVGIGAIVIACRENGAKTVCDRLFLYVDAQFKMRQLKFGVLSQNKR